MRANSEKSALKVNLEDLKQMDAGTESVALLHDITDQVKWCEALSSRGQVSEIRGSSSNNGRDPFSPSFMLSNCIQMKNSRFQL